MNDDSKLFRAPKVFELQVSASGEKLSETFELDKTVKKILGVAFASEKPDLLYHRGYARLEINKKEYFPENHAIQRIMNGVNTSMDIRYWPLKDVIVGNGLVKMDFQDKPDGRTAFVSYTVQIYLDCMLEQD